MFQKATKKKLKARVALIGPAGSGKTYTALTVGRHLGKKIAVIDTERGSASKYSGDVADFDVCELPSFAPRDYVRAISGAADAGYDVLIIDSLSHAWEGEGGILDQVDKRGKGFESWKDMSPQTRQLIDAILSYPGHVIATLRSKTEWVVEERENRNGKATKAPRKIGLAPKFKDGLEYEFDVVALMDDAVLTVTKSRCSALADASVKQPGKPFADALLAWLDDGEDAPRKPHHVGARAHGGDAADVDSVIAAMSVSESEKRRIWHELDADTKARVIARRDQIKAAKAEEVVS